MRGLRRRRLERIARREPARPAAKPGPEMCERGEHELTPAVVHVDRQGKKRCRACWAKYGPDADAS